MILTGLFEITFDFYHITQLCFVLQLNTVFVEAVQFTIGFSLWFWSSTWKVVQKALEEKRKKKKKKGKNFKYWGEGTVVTSEFLELHQSKYEKRRSGHGCWAWDLFHFTSRRKIPSMSQSKCYCCLCWATLRGFFMCVVIKSATQKCTQSRWRTCPSPNVTWARQILTYKLTEIKWNVIINRRNEHKARRITNAVTHGVNFCSGNLPKSVPSKKLVDFLFKKE